LCSGMAIIDKGAIVLKAEPLEAMARLRGRIWHKQVEKDALAEVERDHAVIATKMIAGRTFVNAVRVDGTAPGPEWSPVEPDLKDVYFCAMGGHLDALS